MEPVMPIDATSAAASAEVLAAERALRELAERDPARWWSGYELKAQARNGWSAAAMSVALNRLVDGGTLERASRDRIRLSR
jgi:hypothetical protein